MRITIDRSDLRRLEREVEQMQTKIPQAIAQGLNDGGNKTRTQVQRALKAQTGLVRLYSVTSRIRTAGASVIGRAPLSGIGPRRPAQGLSYMIIVQGKPVTRPQEFRYSVKRGKGGGVIVWMWNTPHQFKRSFQVKGATGFAGLRMRTEGPRYPIRTFKGPDLAKEVLDPKGQAYWAFRVCADAFVLPAIEKRLRQWLVV